MVAVPRFLTLSRSGLPVIGGVLAGVLVLGTLLILPQAALEAGVWRSGIAALIAAAHPPLGMTARLLLAVSGAIGAAAVTWSALYLIFGPGGPFAGTHTVRTASKSAQTMSPKARKLNQRRADRHPDAPPRPPMRAADLGTPLMEVTDEPVIEAIAPIVESKELSAAVPPPPAEAPLPRDLDTPLAAFDPAAMPPVPRTPVRPVAPLAPVALAKPDNRPAFQAGERIETFSLKLPIAPAKPIEAAAQPTVEALLRRLEEKAARRATTQAAA